LKFLKQPPSHLFRRKNVHPKDRVIKMLSKTKPVNAEHDFLLMRLQLMEYIDQLPKCKADKAHKLFGEYERKIITAARNNASQQK